MAEGVFLTPIPPRIDRAARSRMSPAEIEREYGVRVRADVARLWTDTSIHLRLPQKSAVWKKTRQSFITGGRAAGILGYSRYTTPSKVAHEYVHGEHDFTSNSYTEFGTFYEDVCLGEWETIVAREGGYGCVILPFDFIVGNPPFAVSPDGITTDGMLVEAKCAVTREIRAGEIPVEYERGQIQFSLHTLANYGIHQCEFIDYEPPLSAVFPDSRLCTTRVERDTSFDDNEAVLLRNFWDDVQEFRRGVAIPRHLAYQNEHTAEIVKQVRRNAKRPRLPHPSDEVPPPPSYFSSEYRVHRWVKEVPLRL